jgi:hypothetical protein
MFKKKFKKLDTRIETTRIMLRMLENSIAALRHDVEILTIPEDSKYRAMFREVDVMGGVVGELARRLDLANVPHLSNDIADRGKLIEQIGSAVYRIPNEYAAPNEIASAYTKGITAGREEAIKIIKEHK